MSPEDDSEMGWALCTITFYRGDEAGDNFGDTTARKNQFGQFKAIQGETVACDPKVAAYGSWIEIEDKNGKIHRFNCTDTGSDVKKRTASIGRGNVDEQGNPLVVFDIFTRGDAIAENTAFGDICRWRVVDA